MPPEDWGVKELFRGRSRRADVAGVPEYTRVYLVRTDIINPNLYIVASKPGVAMRSPYPDDSNAVLVEASAELDGESPYHYRVTHNYKYLDETALIPWNRPATYSFSGSLVSAPAFWHYPNSNDNSTKRVIVNSAGDPLSGLDRDEGEFNVSIQWNIKPPFDYAKSQAYTGAINSDSWSGGGPNTWKCQGFQASRKFESIPGQNEGSPPVQVYFFDTTVNLSYRRSGWDIQTWDVGFNEIVGGQRKKIMAGSEPVSEPAALLNGRAKTPGQPPELLLFRVYAMLPFTGVFPPIPTGSPTGYPY
jgi:hypothetical protein